MVRQSAIATVRCGLQVIHCYDEHALRVCLQQSSCLRADPDLSSYKSERTLLDHATDAAQTCLGVASTRLQLRQPASKVLGTALRTSALRQRLASVACPDGTPLLKQLSYISHAADAQRHLTIPSIREAVALLEQHLSEEPETMQASTSLSHERKEFWIEQISSPRERVPRETTTPATCYCDTEEAPRTCSTLAVGGFSPCTPPWSDMELEPVEIYFPPPSPPSLVPASERSDFGDSDASSQLSEGPVRGAKSAASRVVINRCRATEAAEFRKENLALISKDMDLQISRSVRSAFCSWRNELSELKASARRRALRAAARTAISTDGRLGDLRAFRHYRSRLLRAWCRTATLEALGCVPWSSSSSSSRALHFRDTIYDPSQWPRPMFLGIERPPVNLRRRASRSGRVPPSALDLRASNG